MALTPSTMHPLGTHAPPFDLPDVTAPGHRVSLATFAGRKALLVMFICRHCPYVVHVQQELARIGHEYQVKGLGLVAISSNNVKTHPADAPDQMKLQALEQGFSFPYAYDETQAVAKAYTAACTPDFFLYDAQRKLVYRGQLDDSRPGNGKPVTGRDLRAALDAVLAGNPVPLDQKPSMGCNIKWKEGHAPTYFG